MSTHAVLPHEMEAFHGFDYRKPNQASSDRRIQRRQTSRPWIEGIAGIEHHLLAEFKDVKLLGLSLTTLRQFLIRKTVLGG